MKKLMIAVGFFLVLGACMAAIGGNGSNTAQVTKQSTDSATTQDAKQVTLEKYNQIKNGMTYKEVVKIIGFEGTEDSQSEVGGIKTVMYTWQNDDGSNMNATFQNGKLVEKAQFGLK